MNTTKKAILMLTTVLLLTACSSDPVLHGLTQQEKETYGQAIAGDYPGSYTILYTDNGLPQTPDGDQQLMRTTIDDALVTVDNYTTHALFFHDFPLSVLSRVVEAGSELQHALDTLQNRALTATYEFRGEGKYGLVNWAFDVQPIPLTLSYGGMVHHLYIHFKGNSNFYELAKGQIESGTAFNQGRQLQLSLSAIYEGDQLVQEFDNVWTKSSELMLIFQFGRAATENPINSIKTE